ncbi:MAG TPA: hypothetical protein VFZ18_11815 [Longimicrobiaceae bacterium]
MPTLHVDLREGFDGDTVVVEADGRELYRKSGVKTNYSIGLADRVTAEVAAGDVRVDVTLPERGLRSSVALTVSGPATLAFSLDPGGALTGREVEASPRYL